MRNVILQLTGLVVAFSSFPVSGNASERVPFRPAQDRSEAILISLSRWAPMRDVQFQLSIVLGHRGTPIYLTAEDRDYLDLLERFRSEGLSPALIQRIPIQWNVSGWARDYGPLFQHSPGSANWSILPLVNTDGASADLAVARYFSEKLTIPIGSPFATTLPGAEGNLLADENQRCYTAGEGITDSFLKEHFSCSDTIRFPCRSTNCHIDENLVFLKNGAAVTDQNDFVATLKLKVSGPVLRVPQVDQLPLTNVLVVNGWLYLLSTNDAVSEVQEAKRAYESLGYSVVLIPAQERLGGGLHCITKEVPFW